MELELADGSGISGALENSIYTVYFLVNILLV